MYIAREFAAAGRIDPRRQRFIIRGWATAQSFRYGRECVCMCVFVGGCVRYVYKVRSGDRARATK